MPKASDIISPTPSASDLVTGDQAKAEPTLRTTQRKLPSGRRNFGDTNAVRDLIYSNVLDAATNIKPVQFSRYSLNLDNVHYADPADFSLKQQKEAILTNKTLDRRLRGTFTLSDTKTGAPIDQKEMTIARVPHMSQRGTFIIGGTEYVLSSQLRLLPGIYTRQKANQQIEAHMSPKIGTGISHKLLFEPETGLFKINVAQSHVPLMPLLRAMGISDDKLRKAWGNDLFEINKRHDSPHIIDKLHERLVRKSIDPNAPQIPKAEALVKEFNRMELDPEVTKRTLGHPYKNIGADTILATTKKLVAVNKREVEPDDRDHMAYQTLIGPEDLIAERIAKDRSTLRDMLWKASFRGNLERVQPGAFTNAIQHVFMKSGLGQAAEEVNAAELLDHQGRITRLGEGGIGDAISVPAESRSVHPSQFAFIDPIRTPDSFKAGVDLRGSFGLQKGTGSQAGKLYAPFYDVKTNKLLYKTPQEIADLTVSFPYEMASNQPIVRAMQRGQMKYVPREEVDLEPPHMESAFSPLSNMIPMKSASKGHRLSMGARMLTQALPLLEPEAPHVRSKAGRYPWAFEEQYGRKMGTVTEDRLDEKGKSPLLGGTVLDVSPEEIKVKYDDGVKKTYQLYNNFPYNRKCVIGETCIIIKRLDGTIWKGVVSEYAFTKGDQISSIDPFTYKASWEPVTGYEKLKNDKKLFRVKTRSKRSVTVTEDHSLVVMGDDVVLKASYPHDCKIGYTRIPIIPLPATSTTTIDLPFAGMDIIKLGHLVGLYLSEGHCPKDSKNAIWIAVKPLGRAKNILTLCRGLGLQASFYQRGGVVKFRDQILREWLLKHFSAYLWLKFIPSYALSWPKEFLAAVIAGYFAGDGCLHTDHNGAIQLVAYSVSVKLRDSLMDVLSVFGIFTTRAKRISKNINQRDAYGFRVISSHLDRLPGMKWFFYTERQKKFKSLVNKHYRSSSFDAVPVPSKKARQILYEGFSEPIPNYIYKTAHLGAVARHRMAHISGLYRKWADSNVMWDLITSIEQIAHQEYVYDLEVASTQMYAVNDGLVIHNTFVHNTALVKKGDRFNPGDLLAKSNYTDDQGTAALGVNARVAYIPFRGLNYEDAIVVSESMAKRLTSEHMYQSVAEWGENAHKGKNAFISLFPGVFNRKTLDTLDTHGVVKPGTVVNRGDPLVLMANEKERAHNQIHRSGKALMSDNSILWEHNSPGMVTDVVHTRKGALVTVKAYSPAQIGDKISGRVGDKGTLSEIVPDDQMPHGEDGKPFEVLLSPSGLISRINATQAIEGALGKISAKTGKPYRIEDFNNSNYTQFALDELKKHGMSDTETVTDPLTGRKIPNIFAGNRFIMKLMHTSETKAQGRGAGGGFTSEDAPSKGGKEGAKRISLADANALLSHGALDVLRDAHTVRGQRNSDYWLAFESGKTPSDPQIPLMYQKFVNQLKAAGVNVVREGTKMHIMALTDRDIEKLTKGRELKNPMTVSWKDNLKPVKGGLFDPGITGGHGNVEGWSKIPLTEPMPNSAFEEPIRRLLGLTEKAFLEVLSGKGQLNNQSGPRAIEDALKAISVPKEIAKAKSEIASGKKSYRDAAVRRLGYLEAAQRLNIHPKDWILHSVPVLPPAFRQVSLGMGKKFQIIEDPNFLYREVWDANQNLKDLTGKVDDLSEERLTLYNAFKGVTGLGDPVQPKNVQKGVQGVLKHIFGTSPKMGMVQFKLLGTSVNLVARGVATPNPDLDMDSVGIPENQAWNVYTPFIVRGLVRSGMPKLQALKAVDEKNRAAKEELLKVMKDRPMIMNRYPILHKYGLLAFWPKLVQGDTIQTSPVVTKGLGLDYDGDEQINVLIVALTRDSYSEILATSDQDIKDFWRNRHVSARFKVATHYKQGFEFFCVNLEDFPHLPNGVTKEHRTFYDVPAGVFVIAYDDKLNQSVLAEVSGWSEHKDREVVIVELLSGRQIITDDDPRAVYGIDLSTYTIKRATPSNAVGMFVPRVDKLITDKLEDPSLKKIPVTTSGRLHDHMKLTRNSGYMLGALVGDGWVTRHNGHIFGQTCLACIDPGVRQMYETCLMEVFKDNPKITQTDSLKSYGESTRLVVSSKDFAEFVSPLIGHKASGKHLPPFYLSANKEFRLGMIGGLLDTDGSIAMCNGKDKPQLMSNYSSISIRLMQEVQLLLRSVGIRSRISPSKTPAGEPFWMMNISAADLQNSGVKVYHSNKSKVLSKAPAINLQSNNMARYDMIPVSKELLVELMRSIGSVQNNNLYTSCSNSKKTGNISRIAARKLIALCDGKIEHTHWDRFKAFVSDTNTYWDRVTGFVNTGIKETGYDLSVPGTETFMAADGIILSNTVQTHIPATEEARKEAIEKMLPSANLFSGSHFKVHYLPNQEYVQGLHAASTADDHNRPTRVFATRKDAIGAYKRGEINLGTNVEVLEK